MQPQGLPEYHIFGCLCCSDFTVPNQTSYDPTIHLSYSDAVIQAAKGLQE